MWTPKRIVLLAVGFLVFFTGYLFYSGALGGIDGLPPLPEADLPPDGSNTIVELPQPRGGKLEGKLRQAFGQDCPELKWPLKLELNSRNMVVAARDFTIEDDGRLNLDMISVALFKGEGREAEINTVRANHAYLTFDKKLGNTEKDLGGRRIVAAELTDQIKIVNNHGTEDRTKHLHMNIDKGPLYYDEAKRLIWTEDNVHLEDDEKQPPTDVRGQGLEVHLAAAEPRPEAKPGARGKARGATFTGVERIVLKANVDMHLWVTGGFLSNPPGPNAKAAPAPEAKPEKSELIIYTPGRFEYEFHKDSGDIARFDAPEAGPSHAQGIVPPVSVDHVTTSPDKGQEHDQLHCQHLQLRLRNKDAAGPRDSRPAERGLEVESGHAVGEGDEGVLLTSDSQKLEARGNDCQYDARNKLTVLSGDPARPDSGMSADQDGNKIRARQMQIQDLPPGPDGKVARQVTAVGPGQIDLYDKKTQKRPIHASWKEKLVSTKDGTQDLIILTGDAVFIDDEHDQTCKADTLKVWLASPEGGPTANAPATSRRSATSGCARAS